MTYRTYHAYIICSNTISDLDLINSSEPNAKAKAHKPMRRRSSLDYIRPPERCLLRNSSLNSTGFRSRSLRDVLEDKEADDDSSSSKDSNSMMRIPTRRISRGNSGKRRVTPLQMEGLPSRHLPRKSSAKGSGSFKGSLRRLMEDKETTDLGLGESCASLLSSCSLNSSNQRESIDIMDFGVQNDRYSGSSASASPSMASSALSLAPSATDGFVGWSRSDSSKRIRINLNPKPKADQTVSSTTATTAQRKRCESSSSSVISVDSSGFVNWVNKGQGENSSVHTLSASITSFSSTKEKEESNESSSTNNASSSSAKGLLRKLSTGLTRSTSKHSTWKANNEEHKAYHRSSTILFDETATIEDKQNEFMASVAQPMKPSGSRRLLNRLSRSLGSSLRKSSTSSRALRHSLPNTDNLSDDDDDYSRYAIPRFNADDNVDIGEFHRELYATKKNAGIRGRFSDVLFD